MMKKVLFVATVLDHIEVFHLPFLKNFKSQGWETSVVANRVWKTRQEDGGLPYCDKLYDLPFQRFPFSLQNVGVFMKLKRLIREKKYDLIHCHTPVAGILARLAARNSDAKVVYTAHGFHFYKGAPLKNWLIYYPVERLCSRWTDALITINQEDYELAQKRMKAKKTFYVPGVGVDLKKFCFESSVDKAQKRRELGIPEDKTWVLAVGELIRRKNHETLIRAVAEVPNLYLTIAGRGALESRLNDVVKELKIENRVALLGFRTDVSELCASADIFAFPSFQEGLPVALMEAMARGLPCVCSRIRGNVDLIDEETGGVLFDPNNVDEVKNALLKIQTLDITKLSAHNVQKIKRFDLSSVCEKMDEIYNLVKCELWANGGGVISLVKRAQTRRSLGIAPDDRVLIYVAELNENKNQSSLIDMLSELRKTRKDVKLVLVGRGEYDARLKEKSARLGLEKDVVLTGFRADVSALLAAADIAVPSSVREGLGLNLIEAMASGLPVVAYDNRGHRSVIEDGESGFLVKNGDHVRMAKIVGRLLDDADEYRRVAEEGKRRVEIFGIDAVLKRMSEIYATVLER